MRSGPYALSKWTTGVNFPKKTWARQVGQPWMGFRDAVEQEAANVRLEFAW